LRLSSLILRLVSLVELRRDVCRRGLSRRPLSAGTVCHHPSVTSPSS